ncbi:MAG TPA: hypothetical protein VK466_14415, partial [Terriglobales bacterium]|nr:hypothetical protein [Terriglobales bacterium]
DMFGSGKTVLRAGAAMIYEQPTIRTFIDNGGLNENPSGVPGVTPGNGTIDVTARTLTDSAALSAAWAAGTPLFGNSSATPCDIDNPCDVFGALPHLATPYVLSWNLNLQQQLTKSTVLQVAYVGNHGVSLYSHRDINQALPMVSYNCYNDGVASYGECRQLARPFVQNCPPPVGVGSSGPCLPWVQYGNYLENFGNSIYHGLQTTLTQKTYRGLNFLLGYTYAHAIDNGTSNRSGYPQDSTTFNSERGSGDYDIRHRFTLSMTYDVPTFHAPAQLGQGWQFTSIWNFQTGEPYNFYDSYDDMSFTGEFLDRWNFYGNPGDIHWTVNPAKQVAYLDYNAAPADPRCAAHASQDQLSTWGRYVAGSTVITPPEYGTFGNMSRNLFRGPGYANWDMSVTKLWKLGERFQLQMRGEFFNILNHPNFDLFTMNTDLSNPPYGIFDLGVVKATPDVGAANPVVGSGGSRHIQLGLKIIW